MKSFMIMFSQKYCMVYLKYTKEYLYLTFADELLKKHFTVEGPLRWNVERNKNRCMPAVHNFSRSSQHGYQHLEESREESAAYHVGRSASRAPSKAIKIAYSSPQNTAHFESTGLSHKSNDGINTIYLPMRGTIVKS